MSRNVVIATVSVQIEKVWDRNTPEVTVERALSQFDDAAGWNPDLIVFPEEINIIGLLGDEATAITETIPDGPVCRQFAERARRHNVNVVVGLRERDDDVLYNTGVVFDRKGEYVGSYRKTHLCPTEVQEVRAGDSYPVFQLDFGKIGVLICMDIHYPEIWSIMALQGADIITHPTMWFDYTGDLCESVVNTRAIDNQVYVVTSHYVSMPCLAGSCMGYSRIVDPYGRTRATTSHRPGVAVAEVDLDESYEYWATGETKKQYPTLKECFLGMRRPETYGILFRPDGENSWRIENPTLHSLE